MSLSHAYAAIIQDAEEKGLGKPFAEKLIRYMKAKGHTSLLPQVMKISGRMAKHGSATVVVSKKSDAEKYKSGIASALTSLSVAHPEIIEDERIVGGYVVRGKGKIVDNSFRSALVSLYRSIVRF